MDGEEDIILQTKDLTKRFGGLIAVSEVDFELQRGKVKAIVGDNGAGKSTFIKMLSGALQPTGGEILFKGESVSFDSPRDTKSLGIETVYQDLALIERMSVADNIFLGRESVFSIAGIKFVRKAKMQKDAEAHLKDIGINVESAGEEIMNLSGGQRQSAAVARAVFTDPEVIIMDEPTAALGVKEARKVLDLIGSLSRSGISIILISHTLPYVFEVADRIVTFRSGKKVYETSTDETDESTVVEHMLGAGKTPSSLGLNQEE